MAAPASRPEFECPICFEAEAHLCLPCEDCHRVCRPCWRRIQDKSKCPICRGVLTYATLADGREEPGGVTPSVSEGSNGPSLLDMIFHIAAHFGDRGEAQALSRRGLDLERLRTIANSILQGAEILPLTIDLIRGIYRQIVEDRLTPPQIDRATPLLERQVAFARRRDQLPSLASEFSAISLLDLVIDNEAHRRRGSVEDSDFEFEIDNDSSDSDSNAGEFGNPFADSLGSWSASLSASGSGLRGPSLSGTVEFRTNHREPTRNLQIADLEVQRRRNIRPTPQPPATPYRGSVQDLASRAHVQTGRQCKRCRLYRPPSAYDPRRRICTPCRAAENAQS